MHHDAGFQKDRPELRPGEMFSEFMDDNGKFDFEGLFLALHGDRYAESLAKEKDHVAAIAALAMNLDDPEAARLLAETEAWFEALEPISISAVRRKARFMIRQASPVAVQNLKLLVQTEAVCDAAFAAAKEIPEYEYFKIRRMRERLEAARAAEREADV